MKSNFHERLAARLEAYERLAASNEQAATDHWKAAHAITDRIPMGQPILVGHHSEGRHRRDLQRSWDQMGKSVEADRKAKYYRERVESLMNNTAISSDDPDALDKLKEKLEALEDRQELMKETNAIIRKKMGDAEKVGLLVELGFSESRALKLVTPDERHWWRVGFAPFELTNNNAGIKRVRDRITQLEEIASMPYEELEYGEVKLVVNPDDNRVQIHFPGKPEETVRTLLKGHGFVWAPSVPPEGAWQRKLSRHAIYYAKHICEPFKPSDHGTETLS